MNSSNDPVLQILERRAPKFPAAVERAKTEQAPVITSVRAFLREADLLYACLAYAAGENVEVRLLPVPLDGTAQVEGFK